MSEIHLHKITLRCYDKLACNLASILLILPADINYPSLVNSILCVEYVQEPDATWYCVARDRCLNKYEMFFKTGNDKGKQIYNAIGKRIRHLALRDRDTVFKPLFK